MIALQGLPAGLRDSQSKPVLTGALSPVTASRMMTDSTSITTIRASPIYRVVRAVSWELRRFKIAPMTATAMGIISQARPSSAVLNCSSIASKKTAQALRMQGS